MVSAALGGRQWRRWPSGGRGPGHHIEGRRRGSHHLARRRVAPSGQGSAGVGGITGSKTPDHTTSRQRQSRGRGVGVGLAGRFPRSRVSHQAGPAKTLLAFRSPIRRADTAPTQADRRRIGVDRELAPRRPRAPRSPAEWPIATTGASSRTGASVRGDRRHRHVQNVPIPRARLAKLAVLTFHGIARRPGRRPLRLSAESPGIRQEAAPCSNTTTGAVPALGQEEFGDWDGWPWIEGVRRMAWFAPSPGRAARATRLHRDPQRRCPPDQETSPSAKVVGGEGSNPDLSV